MYNLDENILLFIQENIRNPVLTKIFVPLTVFGNAGIFLIILGIVLSLIKKTRRLGVGILTALLINFIINDLFIKNIIRRVRPFNSVAGLNVLIKPPKSFSFPSGHTSSFFACTTVIFNSSKKYGTIFLLMSFMMGFSRMYVGVHYPSDVLAGMIIGIISGISTICIYRLFDKTKELKS